MTDELQRTVGEHGGRLLSVEADLKEIKADVKDLLAKVNQAQGGWKTLILVSGIAGSMGALVGKFMPFLAR